MRLTVADLAYLPSVVINLDRRADRWQQTVDECARVGLTPRRVPATEGLLLPRGPVAGFADTVRDRFGTDLSLRRAAAKLGALRSHRRAVRTLLDADADAPVLLLMQDDVRFTDGFADRLPVVTEALPDGWKVCSGGAIHFRRPEPIEGAELVRARGCWSAHFLLLTRDGAEHLERLWGYEDAPVDEAWRPIVEDGDFYSAAPLLVDQHAGRSDISMTTTDPYRQGRDLGA